MLGRPDGSHAPKCLKHMNYRRLVKKEVFKEKLSHPFEIKHLS